MPFRDVPPLRRALVEGASVDVILTAVPWSGLGWGGLWVGGTPFAAPDGACVARIDLLPDNTLGITGDIRVDCVAMFPTDTYDPLAP